MRSTMTRCALGPALGLTLMLGCAPEVQLGSAGTKGRLDFVAYGPDGCEGGCGVTRAFAAGASASMYVGGEYELAEVRSSNPAVASAVLDPNCQCDPTRNDLPSAFVEDDAPCPADYEKHCSYGVELQTATPGKTRLSLFAPGGALVDAIDVRVARPVRAEFVRVDTDAPATDELVLKRGERVSIATRFFDDQGQVLNLARGQSYRTTGLTVLGLDCVLDCIGHGAGVTLFPFFAGDAALRVTLGDFAASIAVRVVP